MSHPEKSPFSIIDYLIKNRAEIHIRDSFASTCVRITSIQVGFLTKDCCVNGEVNCDEIDVYELNTQNKRVSKRQDRTKINGDSY